jgi:hypothetical protein
MRRSLSLLAVALSALTFGVAQAAADEPGAPPAQTAGESAQSGQIGDGSSGAYQGAPSNDQTAGESAESGQTADGSSGAYQDAPSNRAISVRVLSPGDDGDVTQSNDVSAASLAANANKTNQSTDQSQGGGYGSDGTQVAGQEAQNHQSADADAAAVQKSPSNQAINVRVLSPGSNGDVTQSNEASAGALAANGNKTDQDVDQTQAGGSSGSDSTQVAGQDASNKQKADADATAVQLHPTNESTSVRVLSKGDNGDVSQSNSTTAVAAGLNGNKTDQDIDQTQGGKGSYDTGSRDGCKCSGSGSESTQVAGQDASNKQKADADATAVQLHPTNKSTSVRVLSKGDDGDVSQSNSNTAIAAALNGNKTDQDIDQTQGGKSSHDLGSRDGCKCSSGSNSSQIAGQDSRSAQWADADAIALQKGASNENTPVRVGSKGDSGDVWQSNSNTAVAAALNGNKTDQDIDQTQGGKSSHDLGSRDGCKCSSGSNSSQIAGQDSKSAQWADADARDL